MPYADAGEEELFDPLNLLGRAATARAADRNRPETNAKGQHRTAANGDRPSQMKEMSVPAAPVRKKHAEYANAPTREVTYETSELPSLETSSVKISEESALLQRPSGRRDGLQEKARAKRSVQVNGASESGVPADRIKKAATADGQVRREAGRARATADGQVRREAGRARATAGGQERREAVRTRTAEGGQERRQAVRTRTAEGGQERREAVRTRTAEGGQERRQAVRTRTAEDGQARTAAESGTAGCSVKRKQSVHVRDKVVYEEQTLAASAKKKQKSDASPGERLRDFFGAKFATFTKMDWLVCGTGVVILLAVIVLGSIFLIRSRGDDGSVTTMEDVGHALADLGIVGESGLMAVSDARHASQPVVTPEPGADMPDGTDVPGEQDDPDAVISVRVSLTSVEKDLKVKFTNSATGKLINNAAFQVTLTPSSGSDIVYKDDDMDGIIYHNAMTPGTYGVKVETPERYEIVECASSVNVRDTIVYEKIEVVDEIKSESEVNVALEDTQMNAVIEQETVTGTLIDTVEWVESSKTTINNDAGYSEIPKSAITDPSLVAGRTFYALAERTGETGGDTSQSDPTGEPSPTEELTPTPTEGPAPTPTETPIPSPTQEPTPSPTPTETPTPSPVPSVSSVTIKDVPSDGVEIDRSINLTADVGMSQGSAADCTYEWKSSDTNIVSVTGNGSSASVTAKAAGSARITVTVKTAGGEKTAECTITVKAASAKTVTLDKTTLSMMLGAEEKLTATLEMTDSTKYTDKDHLIFSSSDKNVVTVDENGKLKAAGAGTATITVTSREKDANGNQLAVTCKVTVSTSLSVKLNKDKVEAFTGTSLCLVATVIKNGVTSTSEKEGVVTWRSSDTSLATVDAKTGEIMPLKEGTVTISATTVDKDEKGYQLTVSCTVTIKKGGLSIRMEKEKAELAVGAKLTLVAIVVRNGYTATSAAESWVTWKSSDTSIATVNEKTGEVTGVKAGTVTITATTVNKDINGNQLSATCVVTVGGAAGDTATKLKDANGNQVYIKNASGSYVEATLSDYYSADKFYIKSATQYKYTGWQTIDNARYYFDKNGNYVTGKQVIQGVEYTFANNGVLSMGDGVFGIDVSKWNGNIDWNAVKNSGVSYVIIRCGFRGSTQGALIEDAMFRKNIEGARAAGLNVGVYFYTQAVNEVEAVEEASMVLALVQKYRISYPIFIDTEASGGRADRISKETRTAVCRAFCETIRNAGYTPGIYASKSWFTDKLNMSSLSAYKIWVAQYAAKPTYTGRYDLWQYSDKGTISGISGKVDVNYSYLGF